MSDPTPPTVAQLQAEIAELKTALASGLPKAEALKLRADLAEAQAELAALKAPPPAPPPPKAKSGFLDGLSGLDNVFGGGR